MTWRDFGWRLHSRLGVDFRKKGAEARRRLYSFQDIYVTLIKLDLMCVAASCGRYQSLTHAAARSTPFSMRCFTMFEMPTHVPSCASPLSEADLLHQCHVHQRALADCVARTDAMFRPLISCPQCG